MDSYFANTKNNYMVPHSVVEDPKFSELSLTARYLYHILCKIANRNSDVDGWFYHSISQLADKTKMNRRTIMNAKKALREAEFVDIKRGYMKHTRKRSYDYFRLNGFKFRSEK